MSYRADVLVVGGGIAGIAAALSAARELNAGEKAGGFAELNIETLQTKLKARGVKLHED